MGVNKTNSLKQWSKAEKRGLFATCIMGIVLLVSAVWWHRQNRPGVISIPEITLPDPNAYDFYLDAANQVRYHSEIFQGTSEGSVGGNMLPALPISPRKDVVETTTLLYPRAGTVKRRELRREYSWMEKHGWSIRMQRRSLPSDKG